MATKSIQTVHPFPARMASELAVHTLRALPRGSSVLDPMAGSGTVIRQAVSMGHEAIGFDMDPLAVLMSRVWTTPLADDLIEDVCEEIMADAEKLVDPALDWVDDDPETLAFIEYWFAPEQRRVLRQIAAALAAHRSRRFSAKKHAAADVLRVSLSRIIVTKEQCASLARDTSHSRPHKVADSSDYDVMAGLRRSLRQVRSRLLEAPPAGGARIQLGDARHLKSIENGSVDGVLTSPPYLNAIDYLRGHRMSLVWLGHRLQDLRAIRSSSIGAERAPDSVSPESIFGDIRRSMGDMDMLPKRYSSIVDRYAEDLYRLASETSRVLRPGGLATFVMGNSCLKGVFIRNSEGLARALEMCGMAKVSEFERDLPSGSRYLPMTAQGMLGKRMRTETVLVYARQ